MKLPEIVGVMGTVLDGVVEPLSVTVPEKLVTIPLAEFCAWMATANGTLVTCGEEIGAQAKWSSALTTSDALELTTEPNPLATRTEYWPESLSLTLLKTRLGV